MSQTSLKDRPLKKCRPEREIRGTAFSPVGEKANKILFESRQVGTSLFCLVERMNVQVFFQQP